MLARILLRNSTDRQAKAGTIAAQRTPVRALASRLGADEIVEYVEEATSGAAPLDERDVLRRLLADAREGDLVCAFDLSRLTRSDDWEERYTVLGRLRKVGVRPATVEDGEIDLYSIGGRITLHVRAEGAADERKRIRSRLDSGKENAAATGRKPQGATPYGLRYDRQGKAWSLDEQRATIVRELYRRIADGETCAQVAAAFTLAGHPIARSKSGVWTARMVWQIVTRTTYRGEWMFMGKAIPVPAIVTAEQWRAAQARLLEAGRRGLRRTKHVYLLDEGTGRCDHCASALQIRWGARSGQTSYYVCPSRGCPMRWRRTGAADAEVWERMKAALRRPDLIEHAIAGREGASIDAARATEEAASYERQLDRLSSTRGAVLRQQRQGLLSEEEATAELATIARQSDLLVRSAQDARASARAAQVDAASAQGLREALAGVSMRLDAAGPEKRREAIRALRPSVRVGDEIRIAFRLRLPSPLAIVPQVVIDLRSCSCTESQCETDRSDGEVSIAVVA